MISGLREKGLLLIEDNPVDQLLVKDALGSVPGLVVNVVCADTMAGALEAAAHRRFEVVLLDLGLPDSVGIDSFLTFNRRYPELPVIVLTGLDDFGVSIDAIRNGAQDFIVKGEIHPWSLARAIRYAIERNDLRREVNASRNSLRRLTVRLQHIREEERIRISREVHDGLGQKLTALKLDMAWMERHIPDIGVSGDTSEMSERIGEATMLLDATMETVQKIAVELRPSSLDHLGLTGAIRDEVRRLGQRTQLRIGLDLQQDVVLADHGIATTLFRIFQELMTNVIRHAQAQEVKVVLRQQDGMLSLIVMDDGIGMSPESLNVNHSLGLLGIHERAESHRGTVEYRSAAGAGTQVRISIPQG